MGWKVKVSDSAMKELKKLGQSNAVYIISYLKKLESRDDPRTLGKQLKGNLKSFWRYRVGDHRIICEINDGELIVLALKIGHRKNIYV